MESQDISVEVKKKLSDLFNTLNPFQLRKAMEKRLKKIFRVGSVANNEKHLFSNL